MIALLTLWATDVIDMAFVASRWGEFLSASAYYAWVLAILAFAKAHLAPSHPKDRIFSDIYRGVELNPRIGKLWDVKLFHNGHCAMIGWTVIDLSFIALQYEKYGFVTNSIVIVCLIRALVSIDFLWNEHWYLRSIDVCEEPFGYYFTFGSGFFLHSMYTLQSQFLVRHPIILSWGSAVFMLLIGGAGYTIYFIASEQKNMIRETRGNCTIWGKQAECIEVTYMTKDGVTRKTFLICSGEFLDLNQYISWKLSF
ncbi:hypothetical protein N7528_002174 [Penicillium herquei]|nr:hypothetical protein N7528_002174 [Penicillium herquei]